MLALSNKLPESIENFITREEWIQKAPNEAPTAAPTTPLRINSNNGVKPR
tara:strand:- start:282 stop:431 length:150 start_codon:yes stop_codon:yes gene_type:complete